MFTSKDEVRSVLLLFLSMLTIAVAEVSIDFKTVHLQYNTSMLVNRYPFSSQNMVFGTCSPKTLLKNRYCSLVLETTNPADSPDHLRACNITLKSRVRYEEIHNVDEFVAFGDNKAIIVWSNQEHSKKFTIVHFIDCRTFVSKINNTIDIKWGRVAVLNYDVFDVLERYDPQSSCKHSEYCKVTLDEQGNMITNFLPWGRKKLDDTLVDVAFSPSKGRLIVDANSWMSRVRVVSAHDFKVLKNFNNDYKTRLLLRTPSTSKTHELLTVCYEYNFSSFECAQLDSNGTIKFVVLLYIHTTLESIITVHNLPGGGFLMVNSAFYYNNFFCKNCFTVAKINPDGYKVGNKDFVYLFPYRYRFDFREVHFRVNENGTYCLSHPFESDKDGGFEVNLTIVCFDDSDLTTESA